jgi:hypothetical protein
MNKAFESTMCESKGITKLQTDQSQFTITLTELLSSWIALLQSSSTLSQSLQTNQTHTKKHGFQNPGRVATT